MRTLYLECNMGAAGDMLLGALLDLCENKEPYAKKLNALGIPKVKYVVKECMKCQIMGTGVDVLVDGIEEHSHSHELQGEQGHNHTHLHHHSSLCDVEKIISSLELCGKVKQDAIAVYRLIAEAEAKAHGREISDIHFHEVGTLDAIADVVGVCFMLNELGIEKVVASPVHLGFGEVRCAHGILPVPAPATAYILRDVPVYGGSVRGELCTPTGAALLKHFASDFGNMPVMRLEKTGYGMGKKDFEQANCVRAMLGNTGQDDDTVTELCVNLDDMTPEKIGFVTELLLENGANDVYTIGIQMKKNRPGVLLSCLCDDRKKEELLRLLFKHTTTLGVREYKCRRYILDRCTEERDTYFGKIRIKKAEGYGVLREKPEYEDIARIAREYGKSLQQVEDAVMHSGS